MESKLHITSSPHFHSGITTSRIMLDVIISLIPALIAGTVIFGIKALLVVFVCIASCVISEYLFNLIIKKEQTISDLSAVVTGLLLGLNLPVNLPIWQAIVGSVFAIIVVKCIFGGIGCNVVNPAITARVFMLIAFGAMAMPTSFVVDTLSSPTPLESIASGNTPDFSDLIIGTIGGSIGETCVIALVLGGIYLLIRKVITWHVPVAFIGSAFVFSFLFDGFDIMLSLAWILSGGLFLGAIFMATDYVTSPSSNLGKIIFGIGAGFITVVIRLYGAYPEGVSLAILLMNIINPYIDSLTTRKLFGGNK